MFLSSALVNVASANGSVYSRYGLGDIRLFGGSRLFAMGNAGVALQGDGFINRLNPAGLAGISETRISGGFQFNHLSAKDDLGSSTYATGEFRDIAFAFPIYKPRGATLALEAVPYSTVDYAIARTDNLLGIVSQQKLFGTGGLMALRLGGSYSPIEQLSLGVKFNYLFGAIRQLYGINFEDESFTASEVRRARYLSGSNVTVGSIYSILPFWSFGAIATFPATLSGTTETLHVVEATTDTIGTGSTRQEIPLAVGFGTSLLIAERYVLTADFHRQFWKPENFPPLQSVEIRASTSVGAGFEVLPAQKSDTYWGRVAYRLGFLYNGTYLRVQGEPIDEIVATAGLGLPIGYNTRLQIGLQAGMRGTAAKNLQRETILRLSFSLSASEPWFIQFTED